MKNHSKLILGALLAMCSFSNTAFAVAINITVDSAGNLLNGVGVAAKTQYGQGDNNPASNLKFLKNETAYWNAIPSSPFLPTPGALALSQDSLSGNSYAGMAGYQYVVLHFGAGPAGSRGVSPGGYWAAYYLGGGSISFQNVLTVNGQNVGGFSSARYFGTANAPEAGISIVMLGLSLVGIEIYRRKSQGKLR